MSREPRSYFRHSQVVLGALCVLGAASPALAWTVARSEHFEIYAQAGPREALAAHQWFAQLRAFFAAQTGALIPGRPRLRVIGFASTQEYAPYRLRPASDAYYLGSDSRDYIVLPGLTPREFRMAAHEYAHVALHAGGARLPAWLSEGLAEFYSTLEFSAASGTLGGEIGMHTQTLRRRPWLPLESLLAAPREAPGQWNREQAALFYAQSWALTHLLALAPAYQPGFARLVEAIRRGESSRDAFARVYRRPLEEVEADARRWIGKRAGARLSLPLPEAAAGTPEVTDVPAGESDFVLADLLLAAGDLERARVRFAALEQQSPTAATVAALGMIALRQADPEGARRYWKLALERGIADAGLCFRYAVLAGEAGAPSAEIRAVLERALALDAALDDARYHLALLENNDGRPAAAVAHFRALRQVKPERAFSYWSGLADAFLQLGRREEARAAAAAAAAHAASAEQRAQAARLDYVARTDLAVQFTRDEAGRVLFETTRIPLHAADWNPFVEAGDKVRRVEAAAREIECSEDGLALVLESAEGRLRLRIADPARVQVRNGPPEFVCGPQPGTRVLVVYAEQSGNDSETQGLVRGLEFR